MEIEQGHREQMVTLRIRMPLELLIASKAYQASHNVSLQRLIQDVLTNHLSKAEAGLLTDKETNHERTN